MRLDLPEAAIDARFPRLRGAECFSAVLEPGEALLIPAVYLHEVLEGSGPVVPTVVRPPEVQQPTPACTHASSTG